MNGQSLWRVGWPIACSALLLAAGAAQAQKAPAANTAAGKTPAAPATPSAGNGRPAPNVQGMGSFMGGGWKLNIYACYRGGNRLLCDFDLLAVNGTSGQTDTAPFYTLAVVNDGGKVTQRHDAYFVATDGSRLNRGFFSSTPLRYVMEFDSFGQAPASVTMSNGGQIVKNVPVIPFKGSIDQGSMLGGGWRLSLYACYRAGARVLCDFDLTAVNGTSGQVDTAPFYTVAVIDSGGKITQRSDAYYLANDGSRMPRAFFSDTPVRYIMEFDNIAPNVSTVGVSNGGYQIPNIPVASLDQGAPQRSPMVWPDRTGTGLGGLGGLLGGTASGSGSSNGQQPSAVDKASDAASQAAKGVQGVLNLFKKN